jgi:hypothetical protein
MDNEIDPLVTVVAEYRRRAAAAAAEGVTQEAFAAQMAAAAKRYEPWAVAGMDKTLSGSTADAESKDE